MFSFYSILLFALLGVDTGLLEEYENLKKAYLELKNSYSNKLANLQQERDNLQNNYDNLQTKYDKLLDRVLEGDFCNNMKDSCEEIVLHFAKELHKCQGDHQWWNSFLNEVFNISWWAKTIGSYILRNVVHVLKLSYSNLRPLLV